LVKIYYANNRDKLGDFYFYKYLKEIPVNLQHVILSYQRWQDRQAALFGKLLLQKGLIDLDLNSGLENLNYSRFGRPSVSRKFDFNISHSGDYVVCVFSKNRIGIDLELITPIVIDMFNSQFCEREWKAIETSEKTIDLFFDYWTSKEAVIKADGRGLSVPLKDVVLCPEGCILDNRVWYVKNVTFKKGYCLKVASEIDIKTKIDLIEIQF
jgi:4'-phosphopantetheinyl transferase